MLHVPPRVLLVLLLLGLVATPRPITAQECADYRNLVPRDRLHAGTEFQRVVAADGNLLVAGGETVRIYDTTDPVNPVPLHAIAGVDVRAAELTGTTLYLAHETGLFEVRDLSVPGSSPVLGSVPIAAGPLDLAILGSLALVGSATGLEVLDVADPANPQVVGTLPGVDGRAVAGYAGHAYLGSGEVVDLADPSLPAVVGTLLVSLIDGFDVEGGLLYAVRFDYGSGFLKIYDLAVPAAPSLLGTAGEPGLLDVHVEGGLAYCAFEYASSGIEVLDVSDPTTPGRIWRQGLGPSGTETVVALARAGDVWFAAAGDGGLHVVEEADTPSFPELPPSLIAPDVDARGAWWDGSYLYVSATEGGSLVLKVYLLLDATDPIWVVNAPIGLVGEVVGSGDLACIGSEILVDVSLPLAPQAVGAVYGGEAVAMTADHLYKTVTAQPVAIHDISDPSMLLPPPQVGTVPDTGRVLVDGDRLFVCRKGLRIYDISTPALAVSPALLGSFPELFPLDSYWRQAVAVDGDLACFAIAGGIVMLDISDPTLPQEVGRTAYPDNVVPQELVLRGGTAYLLDEHKGLLVVDVSDPSTPIPLGAAGYYWPPSYFGANGLGLVADDYLWVTSWWPEFELYLVPPQCAAPTTSVPGTTPVAGNRFLAPLHPSPVRGAASIRFTLPEAAEVTVDVLDVTGRRVGEILHAVRGSGEHAVVWEEGATAPGGVYFVRLRALGRTETAKMLRLP